MTDEVVVSTSNERISRAIPVKIIITDTYVSTMYAKSLEDWPVGQLRLNIFRLEYYYDRYQINYASLLLPLYIVL
jgi:hypothetical protein